MKKFRHARLGMTLIEVMWASGVLAIALALLMGSVISISVVGAINEGQTQAISALSSVLEELKTMPFEDVLTYTPPDLACPGKSFMVTVSLVIPPDTEESESEESEPHVIALPLPPDGPTSAEELTIPNPVELHVVLAWEEDNGQIFQVNGSTMKEQ